MANPLRILVVAIVCAPSFVLAQESNDNASVGNILLQPSTITITDHFETSLERRRSTWR